MCFEGERWHHFELSVLVENFIKLHEALIHYSLLSSPLLPAPLPPLSLSLPLPTPITFAELLP